MTKDEVNKLMEEAGPLVKIPFDQWCERFANLVAATAIASLAEAYRCGYEAGVVAEREECAKLFDNHNVWDEEVGERIRARGTT